MGRKDKDKPDEVSASMIVTPCKTRSQSRIERTPHGIVKVSSRSR